MRCISSTPRLSMIDSFFLLVGCELWLSPSISVINGVKHETPRVAGGGAGLVSKHRKVHGVANISATYATNFAIVTASYCGAREFVRVSRTGRPDDLLNSAIGGFGSGAILGRLQGGQFGAVRYSVIFAVAGTTVDYATIKIEPALRSFYDSIVNRKDDWLKLPEWSPIKVLDEEALAAKRAREEQLYRSVHNLNKEESGYLSTFLQEAPPKVEKEKACFHFHALQV
ncbi:PREDICTED: uncharacterized protein LOC109240547 isoform X1 [Nicotiana attenuata]|uniref:uncharacterized protein LOC109240547 isoform X1 n=1 Tax=Nicotiana attenuata TaxID=49451 RepID=UPI000904C4BF|nr:PREDICTED: uncharacterized protein LOC109240547 isoform X1 [Nicotiana attenuata]